MNLFFALFLISIALYFVAGVYAKKKMILSILASSVMLIAAVVEALLYQFENIDNLSIVFLIMTSISSILITIYTREEKSGLLPNLFMIVLPFMICTKQNNLLLFLIETAVVILFFMLISHQQDEKTTKRAIQYLVVANAAVIIMSVGYALILSGSGLSSIHGFEAALMPYFSRNLAFIMIMGGFIALIGFIPATKQSHVRLLLNGLFSKILLFLLFRYVVNLFSGMVSIVTIWILLACALIVSGLFSVKASVETGEFRWLRYSDIALNAICFVTILFSFYADNLGYALIAEQIRNAASVMILCSIVIYPAVAILMHALPNVDKTKRFKGIALVIFIIKALLPPLGGFAGVFIIISNISSLLDLGQLVKSIFLFATLFALVFVYLYYIYAHMKFYINVVDAGYEPKVAEEKRTISKLNLYIVAASIFLTFITSLFPSFAGYGISILYTGKSILMLICNIVIMLLAVYFLQFSQVNTSFRKLAVSDFKQSLQKNGLYHTVLKIASFLCLLVAGTFFSVSGNLIAEGISSYAILGVMYIVVSIFMLYNKDIDFQDLYFELFMMLALIVEAVTPQVVIVDVLMAVIALFLIAFTLYRQQIKIQDTYDRLLVNGKIYLYIAFFLTCYVRISWPFTGFWYYLASAVSGILLFAIVYVVVALLCLYVFQKKGRGVNKK